MLSCESLITASFTVDLRRYQWSVVSGRWPGALFRPLTAHHWPLLGASHSPDSAMALIQVAQAGRQGFVDGALSRPPGPIPGGPPRIVHAGFAPERQPILQRRQRSRRR